MSDLSAMPGLSALRGRAFDVLVIGGGIVGAGVMREAARRGLRTLLVEQNDFASGTSSRSSKLVHGGLHYLSKLQVGMARSCVEERQRLIRSGAGLIGEREFIKPARRGDTFPPWLLGLVFRTYDGLAQGARPHRWMQAGGLLRTVPGLDPSRLRGGFAYTDGQTDDARLVLRVLNEGCGAGGRALSYVRAVRLLKDEDGLVVGARLQSRSDGCTVDVGARAVVNATGAWADRLRSEVGGSPRLRLVRGSHLVFPRTRLPFDQALVDVHPETGRPVYLIPWGEVTLVGSTAIEHQGSLEEEPRISSDEAAYLMHWLRATLPGAGLSFSDVLSTFSGLRPIVDRGDPRVAQASREHAVWEESGLVTVTGGKLTTFQRIADDALQALRDRLEIPERAGGDSPVLDPLPAVWSGLPFPWATSQRLMARYGAAGLEWIAGRPSFELQRLPGRSTLVAELRWVARHEAVRHLDDLLLRRVRIGLTSPEGGLPHIESIRLALRDDLGWDGRRWREEILSYERLWWRSYGPPVTSRTRGREREVSVA